MKRFFLLAGIAAASLLTACSTTKPSGFSRYYDVNGKCLELHEPGSPIPRIMDSPLENFLMKNPGMQQTGKKTAGIVCVGVFFHQEDHTTGFGHGPGDLLNRTAFLAMDLPKPRQRSVAHQIRVLLLSRSDADSEELLNEVAKEVPGGPVRIRKTWYNKRTKSLKAIHEFVRTEDRGDVPFGLQRTFHENGMIAEEYFIRNGEKSFHRKFDPTGAALPLEEEN